MENPRILIVEDDAISVASLKQIVEQMGYVVAGIAASGKEGISLASSENPDVILMDIRLRGRMSGIEAAEHIRSQLDVPIIYLTAYSEDKLLEEASETQPYGYLVKPVRDRELRASIETALYKAEADRRLKHLNQMLRSVRDVNQLITREKDSQRLLEEACHILYQVHDYLLVWIGLTDDSGERVTPIAWVGEGKEFLRLTCQPSDGTPEGFPCMEAIRQREAVVIQDIATDLHFDQLQEEILALGFRSGAWLPIMHIERIFCVLCVLSDRADAFSQEELELLQELAADLGFALYNIDMEADRNRVIEKLRDREARLSAIFRVAPIGIGLSSNRIILEVNDKTCEMSGYSREELVGKNSRILYPTDEEYELVGQSKYTQIADRVTSTIETRWRKKDGQIIDVLLSSTALDPADLSRGVAFTALDITEAKRSTDILRESEEKYRLLFDNSSDGIFLTSPDGGIQAANPAACKMLGRTEEEITRLGRSGVVDLDDPRLKPALEERQRTGSFVGELTLVRKSGEKFAGEISSAVFKDAGGMLRTSMNVRDISERKKVEEVLRKSESRFRLLVEKAPLGYQSLDKEGNIIYVNQAWLDLTGYIYEEVLGRWFGDFLVPSSNKQFKKNFPHFKLNGETLWELEMKRKDGSQVIVDVRGTIGYDEKGKFVQTHCLLTDITERKRAEERIQSQMDDLALLDGLNRAMNQGQDMPEIYRLLTDETKRIFRCDGAMVYLLSENYLTLQYYTPSPQVTQQIESLIGRKIPSIDLPLSQDNPYLEAIKSGEPRLITDEKAIQQLILYFTETVHLPKAARAAIRKLVKQIYRLLKIQSVIIAPLIAEGSPLGAVEISGHRIFTEEEVHRLATISIQVASILKHRQAEEALKASEERFSRTFQASPIAIVISQIPDGRIVDVNRTFTLMTGYQREEIIGSTGSELNLYADPEVRSRYINVLLEKGSIRDVVSQLRTKSGQLREVLASVEAIQIGGQPHALFMLTDITERKQAEEALRESEEKYRNVVERANDGILIIQDSLVRFANQRLAEMWGGTLEDVLDKPFLNFVHSDEIAKIASRYQKRMAGEEVPSTYEATLFKNDGNPLLAELNAGLINYMGQTADLVIVRDITQRKSDEQALRESEEKYRNLVERASDGILIIQDTIIRFANARLAEFWGGAVEEIVDKPFLDFIDPDAVAKIVDRYRQRMEGETVPSTYEVVLRRKDKSPLLVEFNAGLINYLGQTADLVIVRDITKRKRDEQALRESEERYRSLFEGVPVGLYRSTPDGTLLEVNPCLVNMLAYPDRQTLLAANLVELYANPKDWEQKIEQMEEELEAVEFETQLRMYDGQVIWTRDIMRVVSNAEGNVLYYEGNLEDITERKQEEQERNERLNRALRQQKALAEMSFHPAIINGDFIEAARSVNEIVATTTDIERVSVWLLDDQNEVLRCIDLFRKSDGNHIFGKIFQAKEYPAYFNAFLTTPVVNARKALQDPRTKEFSEEYLDEGITSVLDSAIRVRGEVIGVVSQEHVGEPRAWRNDEVIFASTVADQMATAFLNQERLRTEEELRRRNQELSLLYEAAMTVSSHLSLDAVLHTVAEKMTQALDSSGCALSLWKQDKNFVETLLDFTTLPDSTTIKRGETYDLAEYPSTLRILEVGEPLVVHLNDPAADQAEVDLMKKHGMVTLLMLPLIIGDRSMGLVEIFDETRIREYSQEEIRLARSMASQAAIAIENARLYEQARKEIVDRTRAEEKIQRRAEEFASLYDTSRDLAEQTDLSTLLQTILQRSRKLLNVQSSSIYLFDLKRGDLEVVASTTPLIALGTRLSIGEGLAGKVASTGKPQIVADYRTWEGRSPQYEGSPFTSLLGVPMIYGGELIGTLHVHNMVSEDFLSEERQFSEEDARLLSMFASQAASAVYNTRLLDETRQRLAELELLYESGLSFSQLLKPEEMGQRIIEVIGEKMSWHHATLRLYDPQNETLKLIAFSQMGIEDEKVRKEVKDRFEEKISTTDHGLSGWAVRCGRTIHCADVTQDEHYIETQPNVHSGLYVPLKVGNRILGVISVESLDVNAFSETDERLLETLMSQAAIALDNARLLGDAQRRLQRNMALREIDMVITSSLDLKLTFKAILDHTCELLEVDAADILLLNSQTNLLEYAGGDGFRTPAFQHTRLKLGEGYAGIAAQEKHRMYIPQLQNRKTDFLRSPHFIAESFVGYYAVPLIAKGKVRGVLEVFNRSPIQADQEWLDFLDTIAGQAAIAIDNITLFEELQKSNVDLSMAYDATIEGWSHALDLRDRETEGHTKRVTEITIRLAKEMGIKDEELLHVQRGALLHDIGKMGIPDSILNKPGALTDEEKELMQRHPVFAYEMLSPMVYLRLALDIPYCHHEMWDGSGYPRGLKGEQIPLAARIFAIADVYDALTSDRPYRFTWSKNKAIEHIKEQSGNHFDPTVVKAFLSIIQD